MVLTHYTAKLLTLTSYTILCHPYCHCYYYGVDHGISYQKELFLWQTRNLVLSCNRILQQTMRGISRDNDVSKLTIVYKLYKMESLKQLDLISWNVVDTKYWNIKGYMIQYVIQSWNQISFNRYRNTSYALHFPRIIGDNFKGEIWQ